MLFAHLASALRALPPGRASTIAFLMLDESARFYLDGGVPDFLVLIFIHLPPMVQIDLERGLASAFFPVVDRPLPSVPPSPVLLLAAGSTGVRRSLHPTYFALAPSYPAAAPAAARAC